MFSIQKFKNIYKLTGLVKNQGLNEYHLLDGITVLGTDDTEPLINGTGSFTDAISTNNTPKKYHSNFTTRKLTALYDGDIDLSNLSQTNIKENSSIYTYGELNVVKNVHLGAINKVFIYNKDNYIKTTAHYITQTNKIFYIRINK